MLKLNHRANFPEGGGGRPLPKTVVSWPLRQIVCVGTTV